MYDIIYFLRTFQAELTQRRSQCVCEEDLLGSTQRRMLAAIVEQQKFQDTYSVACSLQLSNSKSSRYSLGCMLQLSNSKVSRYVQRRMHAAIVEQQSFKIRTAQDARCNCRTAKFQDKLLLCLDKSRNKNALTTQDMDHTVMEYPPKAETQSNPFKKIYNNCIWASHVQLFTYV